MNNSLMTLEEYRNSHPMDLDTVLQIGLDICRSLENGLPHGEINAAGICVTEEWEFVFDNSKTIQEPDILSDIYALGMLMYRLLNKGRLPFMPPYPEKMTKADKEMAVNRCLSGEPFPVPAEGNERITEVLQKACHVNREMRYQSADEMHMALTAATIPMAAQEAEQPFIPIPEAQPVEMEFGEDEPEKLPKKKRKGRKEKKTVSMTAQKSAAVSKLQILFVLLSAALSVGYMVMTKHLSLADSVKLIQFGFTAAQIVLILCATRSGIFLKLLGALAIIDGFCTISVDLFLANVLDKMGRELPRFYAPGYLIVILPIVIAVFYLAGCLVRGKMGYLKNRFYAVIMTLASLFMLFLSVTGMNRMVWTLQLFPYVTGIIMLVFAVLAMENKLSSIAVRIMSFLDICLALAVMVICGFADMVQALGIPTGLVEKVIIALMILVSVVIFFISGKKGAEEI